MLTREEAKALMISRLRKRNVSSDFTVAEHLTIERTFGWVFFCSGVDINSTDGSRDKTPAEKPFFVNKYSEQVLASSISYPTERLIEIYEGLLAKSAAIGRAWCLTFDLKRRQISEHQKISEAAKQAGLYTDAPKFSARSLFPSPITHLRSIVSIHLTLLP